MVTPGKVSYQNQECLIRVSSGEIMQRDSYLHEYSAIPPAHPPPPSVRRGMLV